MTLRFNYMSKKVNLICPDERGICLTIFHWRNTKMFSESMAEMSTVFEATFKRDINDWFVSI